MQRLVVLASGSGTTLQAILDDATLRHRVVSVGSDRPGAPALERARRAGIDTFTVPFAEYADRFAWDRALEKQLAALDPGLVVLAGFMRIIDAATVRRFRIVNPHPALLPAFPGAHALRDALSGHVDATGVTVHWVDEGVDTGPIIAQVGVEVRPDDDEDALRERVQAAEKPLYVATIRRLMEQQ